MEPPEQKADRGDHDESRRGQDDIKDEDKDKDRHLLTDEEAETLAEAKAQAQALAEARAEVQELAEAEVQAKAQAEAQAQARTEAEAEAESRANAEKAEARTKAEQADIKAALDTSEALAQEAALDSKLLTQELEKAVGVRSDTTLTTFSSTELARTPATATVPGVACFPGPQGSGQRHQERPRSAPPSFVVAPESPLSPTQQQSPPQHHLVLISKR